jgi:hypothetical protein
MMTVNDVVAPKCMTHAHGNRFLADAEMRGRAHLLLLIALRQQFFGQSNPEQALMQRDEQIGAGFARRIAILLQHPHSQRVSSRDSSRPRRSASANVGLRHQFDPVADVYSIQPANRKSCCGPWSVYPNAVP